MFIFDGFFFWKTEPSARNIQYILRQCEQLKIIFDKCIDSNVLLIEEVLWSTEGELGKDIYLSKYYKVPIDAVETYMGSDCAKHS